MIRYHLGTVWEIEKVKNTTGQFLRSASHDAVELSLVGDYILGRGWGADLGLQNLGVIQGLDWCCNHS